MSESNSPSVLSYLRQYRFQRKPNESSGSGNQVTIKASTSSSQPQIIRMPAPNHTGQRQNNPVVVYKRIRLPDSDSDDPASPAKKAALQVELTPAIKERRFRNMLEMFPDISPLLVKNKLVKHGWNEERSRDELLKYDPESNDKGSSSTFFSAPSHSKTNGNMTMVRVTSGPNRFNVVVRKPVVSKGGRARRGSSGSEDDDYGVRKGKDDLVYDSDDSDNEVTDDLIGDKKKVFEFLNTSNMNELSLLSGCSQKKAEAIMALRPFKGWLDMVEKFNSNKMLSTDLLNSTQELLTTRNNIQRLMKKCVGLAQQLEAAVAAGAGRLKQPSILDPSLKLAPYQLVGLNWLAVLHKQGVSGILADEMGLGKTVQVIAFLAHLKETGQAKGTHLIVVPASTLDNWSSELSRWCPSLRVSKYYGHPDERRQLRIEYARGLQDVDVVLTTYTMVNSCPEERKMFRITPMHYVIYDEAHMLKNMSTQRYDNLLKIKSKHRLLLTGTPLQNNLIELMSLLCFVMPHMFSGKTDDLKSLFQKNTKSKTKKTDGAKEDDEPAFEQSQITQAKRIMKPFVLRRLKRDVLQDLPDKTNHTQLCAMSAAQGRLYKELISGFADKDGAIHATTEQSGMAMMMDMRKLSNHPLLLRYHYQEAQLKKIAARLVKEPSYKEKNEHYAFQDLLCLSDFQIHQLALQYCKQHTIPESLILDSGKFQKLDEMLPKLKAGGHRVLIFSQFTMMLDILEPYLTIRRYQYLRLDGSTAVTERQDLIDQYNNENIFVFLLSTKAGGLGINLTAADTVIIHDIDFNPYNDKQAEDRCHRLGQTRPVTIYRLISAGTIEEGIYQVAQEKLNLEKHVTGEDENEPTEQKNVVRLLSAALGLTSPNK
ncbi:SWI/SNF-related matrix-associated actin-dependent regulator of chromatin subfamily A containing DEAD/H box 1 homolog isoform X2 [Bombyx mandarina]|uniref:SWI/SNF-related matrix-associated actin-dependent regulator of chromatin subfamily A containing DEAD/H box 1 homolog n=2 Tax=Bombyx TaxID=7090 RepID=A0A8R2GBT2_BOMMO|nr:SWI/SNF-related matrix-associated actin-dependent regulator of chromatin subfamily A containing DEAD/H box 1 homolog [Bombyx mori]XP_028030128.1 SWI/SNF-related matrix-associated actin-dependent regulator of chromatin subfamily A containing DEAD/H box 1 homolog isoform X1 [Bombyx mandarina]XP_028030129.1 SWI/SNF-related matrix-associated actin-dependent regulator of chromatin subfamily A containing DEAD/H box 1 homolog isoform X2 [Bombyx mandarina]